MKIKTERLLLCPLGTEHLESTHEYASDIENTKYMLFLPNETIEETREFLIDCEQEWKKEKPFYYEFALLKDGVHIGAVGIYMNEEYDTAELGWIINPKYHNCGYTTEAAVAIMDFAEKELGIRHFIAHCDSENYESQGVMRKLGLEKVSVSGGRKNKSSDEERQECLYELWRDND